MSRVDSKEAESENRKQSDLKVHTGREGSSEHKSNSKNSNRSNKVNDQQEDHLNEEVKAHSDTNSQGNSTPSGSNPKHSFEKLIIEVKTKDFGSLSDNLKEKSIEELIEIKKRSTKSLEELKF